ncbi:MAG: hypothetical protein AAGB04_30175 [Pseudomonadota bacterium]
MANELTRLIDLFRDATPSEAIFYVAVGSVAFGLGVACFVWLAGGWPT